MTTMIERVARVLSDHAGDGRDYTDVARAAIAVMCDPSPAVIDAAELALGAAHRQGLSIHASDVHDAVIDAALAEGANYPHTTAPIQALTVRPAGLSMIAVGICPVASGW